MIREEQKSCCTIVVFSNSTSKNQCGCSERRYPPVFREIFELGEQVNELIGAFFVDGIKQSIFRSDLKIPETVFMFWDGLSGIILMAWKKQQYIEQTMDTTKNDFLKYSFDTLLNSILKKNRNVYN